MDKKNYRPRVIDRKIEEHLNIFGALCIEGPKWCGKTWTSSYHSNSEIYLGDPSGIFQNRRLAQLSPDLVLQGDAPRLIDEWQEVPPLWDAVRFQVDQTSEKGRFILTGSSTPNHKGILHSGAGRIARLRMRPMSLFESGDSSGAVSLQALCEGKLEPAMTGEVRLTDLIYYILRGGWPASLGLPAQDAALLPMQYLDAIVDDDVYRIDGVKRDTIKIRLLLRSLARNESTTVTNRSLKNDVKEKDLTLPMSLMLADILEERGYNVVLTRTGDDSVSLADRAKMANAAQAEVFVSIHCNALDRTDYEGIFTYYYPNSTRGEALAKQVQAGVVAATGGIGRGTPSANFQVLRETTMPAVLVETGFMTHPGELARLCDPDYQQKIAQGIADGVEAYLKAET